MSGADNNRRTNTMRTVRTKVYKFYELTPEAQNKAVERLYDINIDYRWWDYIFEDAETVGIKITEFDTDHYCKGKFIEDAIFTATAINKNHGEQCDTYKTAETFTSERDNIVESAPKDENGDFVDEHALDIQLDEIESEFLKSILEDYRIMLKKQYEYLASREAIIETIQANEYEFYQNGNTYN